MTEETVDMETGEIEQEIIFIELKKLSTGEMGIDGAIAKIEKRAVDVADIFGVAHGLKAFKDKDGNPMDGIVGTFQGHDLIRDLWYSSGILWLSGGFHEKLASQLYNKVDEHGALLEKAKPIKFGLRIIAVPSGNASGFTYRAVPLIKSGIADPLAEMRREIQQKVLMLSAEKQGLLSPVAAVATSETRGPDGKVKKPTAEAKAAE